ncbi:hypothetical protein AVEN_132705-1 [Araneus ventricosus]|uniref:Uncharacterized protein n=1 Tax=Araneus ventricosus TaxID=182803 RepID=A0A4Y2AVS8_ARAVE|nr:hypothetical protein AVEN_132705-1 [Araneus ventricosus]
MRRFFGGIRFRTCNPPAPKPRPYLQATAALLQFFELSLETLTGRKQKRNSYLVDVLAGKCYKDRPSRIKRSNSLTMDTVTLLLKQKANPKQSV